MHEMSLEPTRMRRSGRAEIFEVNNLSMLLRRAVLII